MVNVYIANTDNSWFDFLSSEADLTEVNFWSPGETAFRAIQQGEILAFRLKSPRNKIGGFGIFSSNTPTSGRDFARLFWPRKIVSSMLAVGNLFIVPKHFFVREIIEERKPLAVTARRAGWVGSKYTTMIFEHRKGARANRVEARARSLPSPCRSLRHLRKDQF